MEKRRKFLVDKKFQSKMIIAVCFFVIAAVVVSGLLSYVLALHLEDRQDSRKIYGARLEVQDEIVLLERMLVVRPIIGRYLLIGGMLSIIITVITLVFYSHRLAGPVYHLEKHLEEMIKGNYEEKLRFRKNDEFKHLADTINRLQDKLKERNNRGETNGKTQKIHS